MHLFYSNSIQDELVMLSTEESRHLARVLRLKVGDEVVVIDGKGKKYYSEVQDDNYRRAVLSIQRVEVQENNFGLEMAVAPTKNINRWEWFLEKATEIGIDRISPILTSKSERKVLKFDRQQRILIAAMKQSYKATIPVLDEISPLSSILKQNREGKKYIAHCYDEIKRSPLQELHKKNEKALVLIGPEGDFSMEEVKVAINQGFESVSLSESRLRTETAAIVACHTINLLNA